MPDILVAEDNAVNRKLICLLLGKAGYSFATVENGSRVLESLRAQSFRLVLMDMMMPGMSGYDATRALRADPGLSHLPVIALTANAMYGEADRCREAGCDAYLAKPYSKEQLLGGIAAFLDGSQRSAAAHAPPG